MERLWAPWRLEYVQHADEQDGCVFCRAAATATTRSELVVHRGERAFVLLNKFPYASGHLLVAPYRHGVELRRPRRRRGARDPPARHAGPRSAARRRTGPEGFNLGWNIGRIAGAGIPDHGHLHVVPRWAGDTNFMPVLADVRVIPEHSPSRGGGSPKPGLAFSPNLNGWSESGSTLRPRGDVWRAGAFLHLGRKALDQLMARDTADAPAGASFARLRSTRTPCRPS